MRWIHVGLLLVVGLCTGLQPVGAAGGDYRLAYYSTVDNEIWTVKPDGTDARQITSDGVTKSGLTASPDGQYLAYYVQSWYEAEKTDYLTLQVVVVLEIATGEQRMVTGQEAVNGLVWSPDSQYLLFAVTNHREDFSNTFEIFRVQRDGTERTRLGGGKGTGADLAWSPDGEQILFTERSAETGYGIFVMAADGGEPSEIVHYESCFICLRPQWTPDSQSVVFYYHPNLNIVDADGQNSRQLTDFEDVYNVIDVAYARYDGPAYDIMPDGQALVYTMGYPLQLVIMDLGAEGWKQRRVIYEEGLFRGVLLSPNGQSVFIQADTPDGQFLTRVEVETGETSPVILDAVNPVIVAA